MKRSEIAELEHDGRCDFLEGGYCDCGAVESYEAQLQDHKLAETTEERDYYKNALEQISADSVIGAGYTRRWITLDDAQEIAREALTRFNS